MNSPTPTTGPREPVMNMFPVSSANSPNITHRQIILFTVPTSANSTATETNK